MREYFGLIGGIIGVMAISMYIKSIACSWVCCKNNLILHDRMIKSLLKAKVSYFDINPVGRILNRSSNDINIIDQSIIFAIIDMVEGLTLLLSICINVFTITPIFIAPCIILVGIIFIMYLTIKPIIVGFK